MIGNDLFVQVFGSVPAGDEESLVQVISNAVREGFAIVLLKPGEKIPICTLNARDAKIADTQAQDAARAIGDDRWSKRRHPCGKSHALTVDWAGGPEKVRTKVGALIRRVMKQTAGRAPNIAVELGLSRRLVIDVDTAAERVGFQDDWRADQPIPGMTVRSPGVQDDNGTWKHKDGGHYWFTIPAGVELPAYAGAYRAPSGWVAMWSDHYVLVPPSTRAEGPYEIVGSGDTPAPGWLVETIIGGTVERMERATRERGVPGGDIDVWAAGVPWAELLEGWTDTGLPDRCSCPIWTAPGEHGSPKSATAHDSGCDRFDADGGHAPLHVWTTSVPDWMADAIRATGSTTFTKPRFLAWRDHGGDMAATIRELGLSRTAPDTDQFQAPDDSGQDQDSSGQSQVNDPFDDATGETDDESEQGGSEVVAPKSRADVLRSMMLDSAGLDAIAEPEPLITGWLDIDTIARLTGKSGGGKSFVMLDMAGCVATGREWHGHAVKQGLVVYMVAEGVRGWKRRMRAWEARYHDGLPIPDSGFLIIPFPIQAKSDKNWPVLVEVLSELAPALIVFDTQARVTVGIDENDATAMGEFVERLEGIRRVTGACVVAVHHLGHNGDHARGSTAMIGALGSELRVVKTAKGRFRLETEKQKDDEESEPLAFRLDEQGDSVVPVPDGWTPGDVFDMPPPPEPLGSTSGVRDRLAAIVWHLFSAGRGATKAEALGVLMRGDSRFGTASKSGAYAAWTTLERDRVLSPGATDARWRLKPEEAARLGLGEPELPPALA